MSKSTPIINCHIRHESANLPPRIPSFNQNISPQYDALLTPVRLPPPSYVQQNESSNNILCNNFTASSSISPLSVQSTQQKKSKNLPTPVPRNAPPPPYPGRNIVRQL